MSTDVLTRLKFTSLYEPFACWSRWPVEDSSLECVEAGPFLAFLPHGDPTKDKPDPFIGFMRESWRCLSPGGVLQLKVPNAGGGKELLNPMNARFFNLSTFHAFAMSDEGKEWIESRGYPESEYWKMSGTDFGTRFRIVHHGVVDGELSIAMEKPA